MKSTSPAHFTKLLLLATFTTLLAAAPPAPKTVLYQNTHFGMTIFLPQTWRGYSVLSQTWHAPTSPGKNGKSIEEQGPVIILRNPKWTPTHPYQDIPVLIFTRTQWNALHNGQFFPFAGGILYELGHNNQYVFTIHSRFNFDESVLGWKEAAHLVDDILASNKSPLFPN